MIRTILAAAALLGAAGTALAVDPSVRLGTLTCTLDDVQNDIVYTDETFDCTFAPESGASESYKGQIQQVGLDLSVTSGYTLTWYVAAGSLDDYKTGALAGTYLGAAASAGAGEGGGVDYLVGGFNKMFALQPWAVDSSDGTGVSLGIEEFVLK